MAGFAFSTVKMTKLLYVNFAVPPLKDGKAQDNAVTSLPPECVICQA